MIQLTEREILALFMLLKSGENEQDETLQGLLIRIERILYEKLSVEEIENISLVYQKNGDILKKRE